MKLKIIELEATAKELHVDQSVQNAFINFANSLSETISGVNFDDEENIEREDEK